MNAIVVTDINMQIKAIWSEILDMPVEDETANFFSLGGSSMQALAITARINESFKLNLTIMDFFETLTIKNLTAFLTRNSKDNCKS